MPAPRRVVLKPPARQIRRGSRLLRPAAVTLGGLLAATAADATGLSGQRHLIYAVGSARWWILWIDSVNPTLLRSAYSSDLVTWTDSATIYQAIGALTTAGASGRNLGVAYKQIASTDVLHVAYHVLVASGDHRVMHTRAVITGTTITWAAEAQISSSTAPNDLPGASVVELDSTNVVYRSDAYAADGAGNYGNAMLKRSTNADAGTSWTAGFGARVQPYLAPAALLNNYLADTGSGTMLWAGPDGAAGDGVSANLRWTKWNGSNWTAGGTPPDSAALYGAAFTADMDDRDLGVVARTTTDVHVVVRRPEAGTALNHWRYNGTTWTQQADLPTQATKTPGGVFVASDGTSVWCFAIASAAGNAIRVSQWTTGGGWGAWADFETASATRASLSGSRIATTADGNLGVIWTEGTAAPFQIVTKPLALSTGAAQPLAATVTVAASVTADLTVAWSLADAETVTATTSASLAVARPLATQATVTATTTADLAATRPLAASVVVVAAWSATLGVSQQAAGVVTVTASGSGTLRAAQSLTATSTPVVTAVAALQVARPLAAVTAVTATGAGDLAVSRALAASAATTATPTATMTLAVALASTATAQAAAQATLDVQGQVPLAAIAATTTSTLADMRVARPLAASATVTLSASAGMRLARPLAATAALTATTTATLLVTRPAPPVQARPRTHDLHRRFSVRSLARTVTAPRR